MRKDHDTSVIRNTLIDLIKGIAVIFVIVTHYNFGESTRKMLLFPFWIDMAVPTFMIVSGYLGSLSMKRNRIEKFSDYYNFYNLVSKSLRILIPYSIVVIFEIIYFKLYCRYSLMQITCWFFQGMHGPGSYYIPLMMQFIFIYPCVYFLLKNSREKGLLITFLLNFSYEILIRFYEVSESTYRLLIFRYLFLIAFGVYISLGGRLGKNWQSYLSFIVGVIWILLVSYLNYKPMIIQFWAGTSCISSLYIVGLLSLLYNPLKKFTLRLKCMEFFGKNSLGIFLVQMVYYYWLYVNNYSLYNYHNRYVNLLINLSICVVLGCLFNLFCDVITKIILKFIKKIY